MLFPWEHIKDRIDRCVIIISGSRIEIGPSALPLHRLPCLYGAHPSHLLDGNPSLPVEFNTTFGVTSPTVIRPRGKSGDAQRLFVFAPGETDEDQRTYTKKLIRNRKACIILPSSASAKNWHDVGEEYDSGTGQAGIDEFAEAEDTRKLVLVARYDGIDLPGDACRLLVIDGLPRGSFLLNRFLDEGLQVHSLRASHTAVRMVQAIGRIFRSNTDHGVVVLTSADVTGWSRSPANHAFLPPLLQKQLQLGIALRENVDSEETTFEDLLAAVTSGNRKWDEFYEEKIDEFDAESGKLPPEWIVEMAAREQQANWLIGLTSLILLTFLVVRTPKEEQMLIRRFGQQYRDYMARTGRFTPWRSMRRSKAL